MSVDSPSRLSTYAGCPLKYQLRYRDKIKRDTEGVEDFSGGIASQAPLNAIEIWVHHLFRFAADQEPYSSVANLAK